MMKESAFRIAEFFLLRTPALPISSLAQLRAEFESGKPVLSCTLLEDDYVREALYLASRNLYHRSVSGDSIHDDRLGLSLARYVYRMAGRPTPFGLFAGVTTGEIGRSLMLEVGPLEEALRLRRIDVSVLSRVQSELSQPDESAMSLLRGLEVAKSSSLWEAPDGFRYAEGHWVGDVMQYRQARIDANAALRFVLSHLHSPCRFDALAQRVANEFGREIGQAEGFLARLVREQLLVPLPQVSVTGDDPIREFLERLSRTPEGETIARPLTTALRNLESVANSPKENVELYERVTNALQPADADDGHFCAIQVDLHRVGTTPKLPKEIVDEIVQQIWSVHGLILKSGSKVDLSGFVEQFVARYGDAAVPLLQALDEDFGIRLDRTTGPSEPLLAGFVPNSITKAEIEAADVLLLGLAQKALVEGSQEIALRDDDLKVLERQPFDSPSAFGLLGSLHVNGESLRRRDYLFHVHAVAGPSSCNLIARFCSGNPDLARRTRDFLVATETSGEEAIVAELAHLPSGRIGNVLLRPVLRSHEIVYMGRSGAPRPAQIDCSDLYLCCESNRMILYSKSLGKRIIPRITSAHRFIAEDSLPVYRFLGMLQYQGEPVLRPIWGALDQVPGFTPRVRYKNLLLSPARWRVDAVTTKQIAREAGGDALRSLVERSPLGPHVRIRDGDNFLELDLSAKLDQALFAEECRRNETLVLEKVEEEELSGAVVDRTGQPLRHEMIIPVSLRHPADAAVAPRREFVQEQMSPSVPGGDWLYARIFCGASVIDDLVARVFPEIADFAKTAGAEKAFFIRYPEHGLHLRLRVQGPPRIVWGPVRERLESMMAPRVAAGVISRFEYATYQPEFRRYGGRAALDLCEHLFALDSRAVAAAVAATLGSADPDSRWKFAFASMARLLRLFGFGADQCGALLNPRIGSMMLEYGFEKAHREGLNDRYRQHRGFIDRIAAGDACPDDGLERVLRERDGLAAPYVEALRAVLEEGQLEDAVRSLLHMTANRCFREAANLHELVLYHFIVKSTASLSGRMKFESRMRAAANSAESRQMV